MTTQVVLGILAGIGTILAGLALFHAYYTKWLTKRAAWALLAAGQTLVTPYATFNLLTEIGIMWKFVFAAVLLTGLVAAFNLASNTKEK